LISGRGDNHQTEKLESAKLTKSPSGEWQWSWLPKLPVGAGRYLGIAGVADQYLVIAAGSDQSSASKETVLAAMPAYRLHLAAEGSQWERIPDFPGGALDDPNAAVVGGELYTFGGWRDNCDATAAFSQLRALGLPAVVAKGNGIDNSQHNLRQAYKYSPESNLWSKLADSPWPVEQGGTVVLSDRYVLHMGSTHLVDSFRVGQDKGAPPGVVTYYGDNCFAYDIQSNQYSRIGKLPYGVITGHWGTNGTHIFGIGGEPSHGWNNNMETAVQVAALHWN